MKTKNNDLSNKIGKILTVIMVVLTAVFVFLKLAGHIAWSWWWTVFCPVWTTLAFGCVVLAIVWSLIWLMKKLTT